MNFPAEEGSLLDDDAFYEQALNPKRSVVLNASAGSGKTWLLVARVVRALLEGAAPQRILAITFTRAAANEMQDRLISALRDLTLLDDQHLLQRLAELRVPQAERALSLQRARTLYEQVLLNGGPTVTTFHGWFLQVLQWAPLAVLRNPSVGVLRGAVLLEDAPGIRTQALQGFYRRVNHSEHGLAEAYRFAVQNVGDSMLETILSDGLKQHFQVWQLLGRKAAANHLLTVWRQGLETYGEEDSVERFGFATHKDWASPLGTLAKVWGRRQKPGKRLSTAIEALDALLAKLPMVACGAEAGFFVGLTSLLQTKEGPLRTDLAPEKFQDLLSEEDLQRYSEALDLLRTRCAFVAQLRAAWTDYRVSQAIWTCQNGVFECYEDLLQKNHWIDFATLELQALRLIRDSEVAEALQLRLDTKYSQVLVDEFQDTNPLQWQILNAWLTAYSDDAHRPSVFLVGDTQQSIYAFRGGDARLMGSAEQWLRRHFSATFLTRPVTRRCSFAVTEAVNATFHGNGGFVRHRTLAPDTGEVWLLAAPEQSKARAKSEGIPWRNPLTAPLEGKGHSAHYLEGRRIAKCLGERYTRGNLLFGDVLLLVRNRTHISDYARALRELGLPFLVPPTGGLLNSLEASDLMALLTCLTYCDACLETAQVLRSPMFSCSDDDLWSWAQAFTDEAMGWHGAETVRGGVSLSDSLQHAVDSLRRWRTLAARLPVHDLLDRVFFEREVKRRYFEASPSAIRAQVQANLEAFLELSLSVGAGRFPSIPAFLAELRALLQGEEVDSPDLGRVPHGEAIRIMTIHGAKGLEAHTVVIADCKAITSTTDKSQWLLGWPPESELPDHLSPRLNAKPPEIASPLAPAATRLQWLSDSQSIREAEAQHLVYVAMTRAKHCLVISAAESDAASTPWWEALASSGAQIIHPEPQGVFPVEPVDPVAASWTVDYQPKRVEAPLSRRREALSPEALRATRLGQALHFFLESPQGLCSDAAQGARLNAARRRFCLSSEDALQALRRAQAIVTAPNLRPFFNVSAGMQGFVQEEDWQLSDGRVLRPDRMVMTSGVCWVLDYKWRWDPRAADEWAQQLGAYVSIAQAWAGRAFGLQCPTVQQAVLTGDGSAYVLESKLNSGISWALLE